MVDLRQYLIAEEEQQAQDPQPLTRDKELLLLRWRNIAKKLGPGWRVLGPYAGLEFKAPGVDVELGARDGKYMAKAYLMGEMTGTARGHARALARCLVAVREARDRLTALLEQLDAEEEKRAQQKERKGPAKAVKKEQEHATDD